MNQHDAFVQLVASTRLPKVDLESLKAALQASWTQETSYGGVQSLGNPALGQCYPTSRVVQAFHPELEIVTGEVDTGVGTEAHFWNLDPTSTVPCHIDLTFSQFPKGSVVRAFRVLDRDELKDSSSTVRRCCLLMRRVLNTLGKHSDQS